MEYGDVSTGISAASVAWAPLGWKAKFFSEIDPFANRLLDHYYPNVPNLGDMTKLLENEIFRRSVIDLLCGGTPCQEFSIAGIRGGISTERGNLTLQFCRLLIAKQPPWFLWENVPGIFSSFTDDPEGMEAEFFTQTADFATLLQAFRECGYCCAWRVLDAQYFGVPQRRRRVFVVGYRGNDWRPPAAVLFDAQSMQGNFTPSKKKRQNITGTLDACTSGGGFPGSDGAANGHIIVNTLDASYGRLQGQSGQDIENGLPHLLVFGGNNQGGDIKVSTTLTTRINKQDFATDTFIVQPKLYSLMPMNSGKDFKAREVKVTQPLMAQPGGGNQGGDILIQNTIVRRLTPLECERLQGFPDNYTNIPVASDTARYKAIGNSMAVPVMRWIGERIQAVDNIIKSQK